MERSLLHITAMSGYDDLCRVLVKEYRLEVDQPDQVTLKYVLYVVLFYCDSIRI